jgi:hypothetical protein
MLACSAFTVRLLYMPVTSHIGPKPVFLESQACSKVTDHEQGIALFP